ncbi:hypothetical protein ACFXAZ_12865 [Streptomyces sp. NPDC059477]|uniref:hypothetical protein n=1 Tax=Streptomyces sp. NPDC059477 TaxID=3346847 RepID=UPI0036B27DC8
MTSQQSPAASYLAALRERLEADGCVVSSTRWYGHEVLVGSRSDRKARWLGTKAQLFIYAAAVPSVAEATLSEFTGWAMTGARSRLGRIPIIRNAGLVLPALISADVQPGAAGWGAGAGRVLGT